MQFDIYTATVKGDPAWLVIAGDVPGFGDTIWKTEADARRYAAEQIFRRENRKRAEQAEREQKAKADAEQAEREDLDGFGASLSPMARGKLVSSEKDFPLTQ